MTTATAPGSVTGVATTTPGKPTRGKIRYHHPITPYLFVLPFVLLLLTFVIGPAVFGIWISLHAWDYMLPERPFIGLKNYSDLFNPESVIYESFWHGMRATAIFTVVSVPFLVLCPLVVALVLNRKFPGRNVFRAIIFAPFVLGIAIVGLLWNYLLDTQFGLINAVLGLVGIHPVGWTQEQPAAWAAMVGMTVWWTLGFNCVIYLAGLQSLPEEHYEAAELDGAGAWGKFRYITIPGLRNIFVFVITMTVLASANMFGQSYLVTNGGPGDSTRTALMVMTEEGLRRFQMGTASAMSYLLAIFLAIISILNFGLLRERKS
ncbi:carbohydrate ABC transporter permease [Microlunatus soli]|uniref:Multiple sugar transport system permease protein n=1 Tax=Microlunatus soli TaxID=630515 RepID=A0A1H1MBH2_9ACTN|nr:sugar ABC transporter permease [Microlunatus soli]SDR84086.1 multiple sugar transport system permease protein [Microlunatus soli]